LVYHANRPPPVGGAIRFEQWRAETWEKELIASDIAIAVKPPDNWLQARKPPTKVLTYLAGALPVVCTPSEADKIVVRHGENSLVAHTIEEWREALLSLLKDEGLRRRLARRGQRDALAFASRSVVGRAHQRLLLNLTGGAGWRKL
ncbi:MAG: glycosyltransferase, partial [Verrucomicrobiia bacterium]